MSVRLARPAGLLPCRPPRPARTRPGGPGRARRRQGSRGRSSRLALAVCATIALGACAATPPGPGRHADAAAEVSANAAAAPTSAAADAPTEPASGAARTAGPTLYDALGGAAGVEALSERFIREIAADDRIRSHYKDTDIGRFHRMMQEQMCEKTGGGCVYTGDDMRRTHGGMNITPVEFNAIVEALMRAMDARGLTVATQNRLLALYAPMYHDIVDR